MGSRWRSSSEPARLPRYVLRELGLWASLYPAYLAVRGWSIAKPAEAVGDARTLIQAERSLGLLHEAAVQRVSGQADEFFAAYYMLGFGPLVAAVLVWLSVRHRQLYGELRTLLFLSLAIALLGYVFFPTAPPRLIPGLGIDDTVGLSRGHDVGSFAGIRFDPYAAMPSMHVGWGVLIAVIGVRAVRNAWLRGLFVVHPLLMAVTVTATGNHYFADSIAGAAIAFAALGVVAAAPTIQRFLLNGLRGGAVSARTRTLPR